MSIAGIGNDFIVDTTTTSNQYYPTITTLADGRFIVTWQSYDSGTDPDIRARIFNADGSAAGNDFLVNTTIPNVQGHASVTALADGRFVITWYSYNGADYDIRARIYNADGSALGGDFPVNSTTTGTQYNPTVTALADGRFVVTYQSLDNIRARLFDADGNAIGNDFLVNNTSAHDQYYPAITTLADGRFIVTWQSDDNGANFNIRARIYNANGSALGGDFLVNSTTTYNQTTPAVMTLANGRFIVTWRSSNGPDNDIRARLFNANGSAVASDFLVNNTIVGEQFSPATTALADGRFVVTWFSYDNGTDRDIRARLFNADGSADGVDFIVSSTTVADQYSPKITALADDRFVVTWYSFDGGDGSGMAVRARIFDPTVFNGAADTTWNNTWRGGSFADTISGGANNDQLYGLGGNDLVGGDAGNDYLSGGNGNDYLSGGDGNDLLGGGSGVNTSDGGSGRDIAFFGFSSTQASIAHLPNGDWRVSYGGTVDTLSNIEVLHFTDKSRVLRQAPVSDFDASNASDVLWRSTSGALMVWEMSEGRRAGFTTMDGVVVAWSVAGIGDFNNDGTADILWRHTNGAVAIWEISGGVHTGSTNAGKPGNAWNIVGVGDFDDDGTSDILWRHANGTVVTWQMGNGVRTGSTNLGPVGGAWNIAGVGDFDDDGTSDILWRHANGTVVTWEISGGVHTGSTNAGKPGNAWNIVGVGDFDDDGTSDILWRNTNGTVVAWEMDGGSHTGTTVVGSASNAWSIAGLGDFNGDGTSDILWRNTNGTVAVWQMKNGSMAASSGMLGPGSNWQIA